MKSLKLIPFLLIFFGIFTYENLVQANPENPKDYKEVDAN